MTIAANLARPLTEFEGVAFAAATARYGHFLGLPVLDIRLTVLARAG